MSGNHWHPNGCGVSIDTIDGHLDLTEIAWQQVAPCGCVCCVTVAATDELLVTADQAARHFTESVAEYERDKERGFTCRAREHKAAVDELAKCEHVPTWGYAPPPQVDGYVWAVVHCHGSNPKLTHLVEQAAVDAVANRDFTAPNKKPLCGGKAAFWWKSDSWVKSGKVECKRCVAAAEKRVAS